MLVALLYTPVMIRLLGQSEYGLYAMIGSVAAYLSIMDLGLGNAIVRYISRNRAIGDRDSESRLNGMFLFLYLIIGLLSVIVGVILYNSVEYVFANGLSEAELQKAKIMIVIIIVNFTLSFPLSIFGSIMQAYERFIAVKVAGIMRLILSPLIILPLLFMGYGSVMMVFVTTLINISILLFYVFYCLRYIKVKFHMGKIDFHLLKEILGYSFFIFLGIIVDQVNWNTGQLILGAVSGTTAVAIFAIALHFVMLYRQFSSSISGVFLPKISMMVARDAAREELTEMMIRIGRIQYFILVYILGGFVLFGYPFIGLWAGLNYRDAYVMTLIIMIPITIPLIQNIGISILQAQNKQGFRSVVLIAIAVVNVIISIPLASRYGGIGVAFGTGISYLLGNALVMNIYYHRIIGIDIPLFWRNILRVTAPAAVAIALGYLLNMLLPEGTLLMLIVGAAQYSLIYVVFMWYFALNEYEKGLITPRIKRFKKLQAGRNS